MFGDVGLHYVTVFAINDLNEHKISSMLSDGVRIDAVGIGTEMGVSLDAPALCGVYKLVEQEENEKRVPKMKNSESKMTYLGRKQVYRISDANGTFAKDVIAIEGEAIDGDGLLVKVM